jgi:hypothetical protein
MLIACHFDCYRHSYLGAAIHTIPIVKSSPLPSSWQHGVQVVGTVIVTSVAAVEAAIHMEIEMDQHAYLDAVLCRIKMKASSEFFRSRRTTGIGVP